MAKILIGLIAVIACFYLAESLDCNKCLISLFGLCIGSTTETCTTNSSVCFTTQATFPDVSGFSGFSKQGCTEQTSCPNNSTTTNGTLGVNILNIQYTIKTQCCSSDKCNPVTISGATAHTVSLSAALSVAALAAVWGSFM